MREMDLDTKLGGCRPREKHLRVNIEIKTLIERATAELRAKQSDGRPHAKSKRRLELASMIDQAMQDLSAGDSTAIGTLYLTFAPRSDWDEVHGSAEIGIELSELLYPHWAAIR